MSAAAICALATVVEYANSEAIRENKELISRIDALEREIEGLKAKLKRHEDRFSFALDLESELDFDEYTFPLGWEGGPEWGSDDMLAWPLSDDSEESPL